MGDNYHERIGQGWMFSVWALLSIYNSPAACYELAGALGASYYYYYSLIMKADLAIFFAFLYVKTALNII